MNSTDDYETLDPKNWEEMRALAHRMVDDAITYLETIRERPVWQPIPEDISARFEEQAPHEPSGADAAYQEFLETIFPYPMGVLTHAFGVGTWAAELFSVRWPILCLRFKIPIWEAEITP